GGLLSILAGIALAVVVGSIWGRTMWMASGGPKRNVETLRKTIEQKREFARQAEAAGNPREADRLRGQIPLVQCEIERNEQLQLEANRLDLGFARNAFELIRFCGEIFLRMLFMIVVPL